MLLIHHAAAVPHLHGEIRDSPTRVIRGAIEAKAPGGQAHLNRWRRRAIGQPDWPATSADAERLIEDGSATGGMIPKLETAIAAVVAGVEAVVILDGRRPHAMLTELFTEGGAGTLIRA